MRFASTLAAKSIAAAPQNDAREDRDTFGLINQWSGGDHTFAPSTAYKYGVTVRRGWNNEPQRLFRPVRSGSKATQQTASCIPCCIPRK